MAERHGLAILTGTVWRARDIETIAGEAENAGFEAIFNGDRRCAGRIECVICSDEEGFRTLVESFQPRLPRRG